MSNTWKRFGEPKVYTLIEVPKSKQYQWEQLFLDILIKEKYCLNLNPSAKKPKFWKRKTYSITQQNE